MQGVEDLDLADALVRLAHQEFEAFGTSGGNHLQDDEDVHLLLRACQRVTARCSVSFPALPFRDFKGFYKYWVREGMKDSYAARRGYLDQVFAPVEEAIAHLIERSWDEDLTDAVSPHSQTGWPDIDREINELRRRFKVAHSAQDHSAVGGACVRIVELLGEAAFDPDRHLPVGQDLPRRDQTKNRFDLIIAAELPGKDNDTVRKLARSVVEMAQEVKHRATPSRRDAGIAADSVIILANILRRIRDDSMADSQGNRNESPREG